MKSMVIQGRRQRFCQQCGRFHDVTEFEGTRKSCRRKLERHNQRRRTVPTKGCAWQSDSEEDEIDVTEDAEYQALANMKRGARSRSARLKSLDIGAPLPSKPSSVAIASPSCSLDRRGYHSSMDLDTIASASNIAGFVPLTEIAADGRSDTLKNLQKPQQPLSSSDGGAVTKVGLQLADGAGSAHNSPDIRLRNVDWSTNALSPLQNGAAGLPAPPQPQHEEPIATPFGAMKDAPFFNELLDDDILGGLLMFPEDISDSLVVSAHDQLSGAADGTDAIELHAPTGYGIGAVNASTGAVAAANADIRNRLQPDFAAFGEMNETATSPRQGAGIEANHIAYLQHQPAAGPITALEAASRVVSMEASALVGYDDDESMLRLSIKLFNCTPDFLAPSVKSELTSLLRVAENSLVEGYIRPGCLHMTLSVRAPTTHVLSLKNIAYLQHQPAAGPITALEAASRVVSMEASALVGYDDDESMLRLSIKLFNCTPDFLAPSVKSELTSLLRVAENSLVEGYIRPGCLHMTLSVRAPTTHVLSLKTESDAKSGIDAEEASHTSSRGNLVVAVEELLQSATLPSEAKDSMLVQLHDELIVVKQKRIMAAIDMGKSMGLLPQILAVRPLAVVAAGNGTGRTGVILAGRRLHGPSSLIMCRQGGRNLTIELPDDNYDDEQPKAETAVGQVVKLGVLGIAAGCAEFEVQVGSFLGTSRPLVALTDAAAVEEVRQLEIANNGLANNLPVDSFLRDLGLVAQYLDRENAKAGGLPVPTYTPELLILIEKIACKLVAAAVSRKWIALTAYLLPATTAAGQTKEEAVGIMDTACPPGLTLLHVAVGTGHVEIVNKLAQWGDPRSSSSSSSSAAAPAIAATPTAGPFAVDAKGLGGITPLHVAAILPPKVCYAMRLELTIMSSAAPKLWGLAQSDDGTTPEGLADMVAGGGRSSSSGIASTRIKTPTYMKPTPLNMSISTVPMEGQIEAGPLDAMVRKSVSYSSLTELSRTLSWKSRGCAKAHFVDDHIGSMMNEIRSLPNDNAGLSLSGWYAGIALGSAVALALGTAAMALHFA